MSTIKSKLALAFQNSGLSGSVLLMKTYNIFFEIIKRTSFGMDAFFNFIIRIKYVLCIDGSIDYAYNIRIT